MEEKIINKPINNWDYQDDDRIFYKHGMDYDFAETAGEPTVDPRNVVHVPVTLVSGKECVLSIAFVNAKVVKIHFDTAVANAELPDSNYIEPAFERFIAPTVDADAKTITLTCKMTHVEIARQDFCLQAFVGAKRVFKTSTKKISRQFVTPGLGQRVHENGDRDAFLSWDIDNGDAFYGLGEKFGRVEKSQTRSVSWAMDADGSNSTDLAYKDYPVLLSTAGFGLMLATARRNKWDIGNFCYSSATVMSESPILNAYLFFGKTLKDLIGTESQIVGRPGMPAPWTLGVWYSRCAYQNRNEFLQVAKDLKAHDLPFDMLHNDVAWGKNYWYPKYWVDCCDFEWDDKDWPEPKQMYQELWDEGIGTSIWLNPYLPPNTDAYREAEQKGYLVKTTSGGVAHVTRRLVSDVGIPDLTNPNAYNWWKEHVKGLLKLGIRVIKPDYTDRIPDNALFANGYTGVDMHNMYINLYIKACYEATEEVQGTGLVWKRPGFLGTTKYPGTWSGDVESTFEGMRFTLRGALSVGFAGEVLWSSDISGFKGKDPDPELYIRWSQMGLLCSLARYHGVSPREPWYFGDKAVDVVRRYSKLRYHLAPYYLQTLYEATQTGLPVMRHLGLEYPDDRVARQTDDEFLIGSDLLVAPVLEKGATRRQVYLPAGDWYELHSGRWYTGRTVVDLPVTLDDIPVFVKAGSAIPTFKHDLPNLKHIDGEPIEFVEFGEVTGQPENFLVDDARKAHRYTIQDNQVTSDYPASFTVRKITARRHAE